MALYINTTKVGSTAYMGSTKLNKINFNGANVWNGKIILPVLPNLPNYDVRYAAAADNTIYLFYGYNYMYKFDGSDWIKVTGLPFNVSTQVFSYNNELYIINVDQKKLYKYKASSNNFEEITIDTSYNIESIGVYNNELYISLYTTLRIDTTGSNSFSYSCVVKVYKLNKTSTTVYTPDSSLIATLSKSGAEGGSNPSINSQVSNSFKFVRDTNEVYVCASFNVQYRPSSTYTTKHYFASILLPNSSLANDFASNYETYNAVNFLGKVYAYDTNRTSSSSVKTKGKIKNFGSALSSFTDWDLPFKGASNAVIFNNQLIFLGGVNNSGQLRTVAQYDGNEWIVTSP